MSNHLFPIFLKIEHLSTLVIGGGKVALEKIQAIYSNAPKTQIEIISIEFNEQLLEFIKDKPFITKIQKSYSSADLTDKQLVISAVNDLELSAQIQTDAKQAGILHNAADKPELCDFYLGSIVQKGNLKIAISTNGKSPTIAKRIKAFLNEVIPNEINESLHLLEKHREKLKGDFESKVQQLNKATASLAFDKNVLAPFRTLKKVLAYILGIVGVMFAGHILFSLLPLQTIWNETGHFLSQLDHTFLYYMLGGFIAQMIDGALGMAYGVSATTYLLSFGVSPAIASMSVHISEIFTSGVSGFMHLRFGNVNNRLFKNIVIPGVIGSILGAYILTEFENYNAYIKPIVGCYTFILGCIIIYKIVRKKQQRKKVKRAGWLATLGGFLDAIGGGGWGPVVSSTLIARGKNPRMVIGSVNLAEFFVSLASSFTFFTLIGNINWQPAVGLILGGVCAAPIAAYVANKLPTKAMMLMVGIIVVIVSLRIIISSLLN